MSYLNALRLHFAGQFQANPSTVNNDPAHFDNATWNDSYQKLQGAHPNGWFNPQGDAAWRLLGCQVTSAWMPSGSTPSQAVPASDPVLSCIVADSDGRVPAKIADLDSEQQLVSEIWGLQVRIADATGAMLMRGDFAPAAFMDLWDRAVGAGGGGDADGGAMWQSVLSNLQWGDVSASPFLTALQTAAGTGVLSIKFNVDGINLSFNSPSFMCGRIAGTIGPATLDEPQHMVIGRQFMAAAVPPAPPGVPGPGFFFPEGSINFCAAVVDSTASRIYLDLGNALSTMTPGGALADVGDLTLSVFNPAPGASPTPLGTIAAADYAEDPTWYTRTAGVVALPLTAAQMQSISATNLLITGDLNIYITEWTSGAYVRADTYVYRMSPADQAAIPVYAMQWGEPLAGATIGFSFDASGLQPTLMGPGQPYVADGPPVATPTSALTFGATAVSDTNGLAVLKVIASDPGTPRWFGNTSRDYGIDGQVYGIRPAFSGPSASLVSGPADPWNFISFLVWSGFTPSDPVTWSDLQPIFKQYANLYPVMNRFLNLGEYDSVVRHAGLLTLAFGLDTADPNVMPATRDLSPAKRAAILTWLANPLPGAIPITPPRPVLAAVAAPPAVPSARTGGKAAAAARRLSQHKH